MAHLQDKIKKLEEKLNLALESGDQATQNLRAAMNKLQEEFDAFKIKSKRDFENMQDDLKTKHSAELD